MKLPRFTLRELFLLVVIAAMGCGWWVERNRHARDTQTIKELSFQREAYMKRAEQLLEGVQQLEYQAAIREAPVKSNQ